MSESHPSRPRRRTLLLIGAGAGVLLAASGAVALVSGLAIADQPGQSLDVPALVIEVEPAPDATAPATSGPGSTSPATSTAEPGSPELVPAPTPVMVDDHGGDRPDDADDDDDTSGSSGED